MMKNKILVIIPSREGSKGIPTKNMKLLAGKPLISYSIEVVLKPDEYEAELTKNMYKKV